MHGPSLGGGTERPPDEGTSAQRLRTRSRHARTNLPGRISAPSRPSWPRRPCGGPPHQGSSTSRSPCRSRPGPVDESIQAPWREARVCSFDAPVAATGVSVGMQRCHLLLALSRALGGPHSGRPWSQMQLGHSGTATSRGSRATEGAGGEASGARRGGSVARPAPSTPSGTRGTFASPAFGPRQPLRKDIERYLSPYGERKSQNTPIPYRIPLKPGKIEEKRARTPGHGGTAALSAESNVREEHQGGGEVHRHSV